MHEILADGPPLDVGQFADLPEEDGYRLELVRGRLVREPRPGYRHGRLMVRLGSALDRHVREHGLGEVIADFGVVIAREPATVRGPDLAFVGTERVPDAAAEAGFLWTAPDLVIEIVSPTDTAAEMRLKVMDYLGAGVRLVWVVDPGSRSVAEHRPDGSARLLGVEQALDGADIVPGFRLELSELFGR